VHRCLPRALRARLDALVAATSYADQGRTPTAPETGVLLTVAQAAVRRRPPAITYRDKNDRSTERVLEPYGVVALRGRWYATGLDSRSGQVRSFRLDRVARAAAQQGQFPVPGRVRPGSAGNRGGLGGVVPARGLGAGPRQREGGADADARIDRRHRTGHRGTRVGAGAMAS